MNKLICSKCKIRPAVIFVSKIEGERTTQEGLCIQCAMKLNIGPIKEIMDRMGISEEELEEFSQQFGDMFNSVDSDSLFEAGGAQTLPLFQGFNEGGSPVRASVLLLPMSPQPTSAKHRKPKTIPEIKSARARKISQSANI